MANRPFTQDVRASLTVLITDDIATNNRVIDPGNPPDIPPTYAKWDDTIEGVRFNSLRDDTSLYMYAPVDKLSTEQRKVDKDFIETFLKGKRLILINGYYLYTLDNISHKWSYQSNRSFEQAHVSSANPTWRGYNMVSQWYWLSDEKMLEQPEYIECACWSLPKADISDTTVVNL